MLRSLIAASLIFTSLIGVANDKDNGFPITTAAGLWLADNGMLVSIRVKPISRPGGQANLEVILGNHKGTIFARGEAFAGLKSPSPLIIPMTDGDGARFFLSIRRIFPDSGVGGYKLEFKFFKTRNSSRSFLNLVLDRWDNTKH